MGTEYPSPDGLYTILVSSNEMRMSHWVDSPALQDNRDKTILLNLHSTLWSADTVNWTPDSQSVVLDMRLYPGTRPPLKLTLWPQQNRGRAEELIAHVIERDALDRPVRMQFSEGGPTFEGSFEEMFRYLSGLS